MDRRLVQRAIDGDHDAFTRLTQLTIDRSYALGRLVLHDDEQARDAVQEAYVSAWRDVRSLRDPDRFEAWLRRLVVRSCYRIARRERRRLVVEVREIPLGDDLQVRDGVDAMVALADRDELERAFRRLDPALRAALVLRHYAGLSLEESADAMGVPLGTAKSRLFRAHRAMRALLEADARTDLASEGSPA
jgi:RNA polymerase sigma-70 factor, ECF subfamily